RASLGRRICHHDATGDFLCTLVLLLLPDIPAISDFLFPGPWLRLAVQGSRFGFDLKRFASLEQHGQRD
ncbi:MAG: hypothetical protein WAN28_12230, partial [Terracidiphilus sp.]